MSEKECMQAFSLVIRSSLTSTEFIPPRLLGRRIDLWKKRERALAHFLEDSIDGFLPQSQQLSVGCPLQKVKGELSASLNTALAFSMGFLFWGFDLLPPAVHRSTQRAATVCSLLLPQSLCVLQMVVSIFNCILILINRPCNRRCPSRGRRGRRQRQRRQRQRLGRSGDKWFNWKYADLRLACTTTTTTSACTCTCARHFDHSFCRSLPDLLSAVSDEKKIWMSETVCPKLSNLQFVSL